jgi:hypothetical protein
MSYLERYRSGECGRVWKEIQALGAAVRREPHFSPAREVAAETMRRVRRNCERIVARLRSLGYVFGTYPDRTRRTPDSEPLTAPSEAIRADCTELESQAGPLPLSLVAFWHEVGSVDLVGMHSKWPDGLDPLVVDPPEGALSFLCETEEDDDEGEGSAWFAALAPDDLHKDNVSGGDPYGVGLPDASADFVFLNERHGLHFVPYLRLAILRFGGLPGLDGREVPFQPLGELIAGLELF